MGYEPRPRCSLDYSRALLSDNKPGVCTMKPLIERLRSATTSEIDRSIPRVHIAVMVVRLTLEDRDRIVRALEYFDSKKEERDETKVDFDTSG